MKGTGISYALVDQMIFMLIHSNVSFNKTDIRFAADKVDVSIVLSLGADGEKVKITDVQLSIELDDIDLELECLFPRNGKCCPDRYLKSCNSVLAKTVLR